MARARERSAQSPVSGSSTSAFLWALANTQRDGRSASPRVMTFVLKASLNPNSTHIHKGP